MASLLVPSLFFHHSPATTSDIVQAQLEHVSLRQHHRPSAVLVLSRSTELSGINGQSGEDEHAGTKPNIYRFQYRNVATARRVDAVTSEPNVKTRLRLHHVTGDRRHRDYGTNRQSKVHVWTRTNSNTENHEAQKRNVEHLQRKLCLRVHSQLLPERRLPLNN